MTLYCAGTTPAIHHAKQFLTEAGIQTVDRPGWTVDHLLLDVPSFRTGDDRRKLDTLLEALPQDVVIWGGNLNHPSLAGFHCVDLLKDEAYLRENAAITADCAIDLLKPMLPGSWKDRKVLILGWGRIGKQLATKLKAMGCQVTVTTRSDHDLTQLRHLGYGAIPTAQAGQKTADCALILNTVPAPVLSLDVSGGRDCIRMDLASLPGIEGENVLHARGLPGRYAPERSGRLIADTILRLWKEESK